ncbi:sulfotransferase family 2 domain-containing protein [Ancylobacter sp.]|uniref:sulfotransferase family 2 domain-containing protein n=1 Tax=Ancylobacter sp. TaxID=1872567 RepID=UPI003D0D36B5
MISHQHKAILVHIQKTGGTSITSLFGESRTLPEKHFSARELRERYGCAYWDSYFKFAVVRNPWDRLISWWAMIDARRPAWQSGVPQGSFHAHVLDRARTFDEFLVNCSGEISDRDGSKSIFRNQIDYLVGEDGKLMVDLVCRFERLRDDFEEVKNRTGITGALPTVNVSRHANYRTYYTPETRELVAREYARDIAFFGFEFDDGRVSPAVV